MAADARSADPRDARTPEVNRSDMMDVFARQLLTRDMNELLFGVPKSQKGETLHLMAVTSELKFEADPAFLKGLASLRKTPESVLKHEVRGESAFCDYLAALENFVTVLAEGALRSASKEEGAGEEEEKAAKGASPPEFTGALRVAVEANVLGEKWSVLVGAHDMPYTVRVSFRVASKKAKPSRREGAAFGAVTVRRRAALGAQRALVSLLRGRCRPFVRLRVEPRRLRGLAGPRGGREQVPAHRGIGDWGRARAPALLAVALVAVPGQSAR